MPELVRKVSAIITRETLNGRQVLLFQHPTAGIQLPAGSVEDGESYEAAVLRETEEETGLNKVLLVSELGVLEQNFEGPVRRILNDTSLYASPHNELPIHMLDRGDIVEIGDVQDSMIYARHRPDLNWFSPRPGIEGWIHVDAVKPSRVERHIFHLQTTTSTVDRWELVSDGGRIFKPFWVNITDEQMNLIPPQALWLEAVRHKLVETLYE